MVDIQEFENLTLDRERFTKELVDELEREAVESVTVGPTHVVLHHVYTERRVDPLDVFAKEASAERRERAAIDYGQAIKDLAAANVFPGDLLIKNFGVTRHGRVVFYDYDELCSLTECRFRTMPTARDDDEMSDGSWFYVGPNDVFPEELRSFIFSDPALAAAFDAVHGELYGVSFWHEQQRRHEAGELIDFFPYPSSVRFPR
jgi:isocitrate dehydrogenase kinase/phosphatase